MRPLHAHGDATDLPVEQLTASLSLGPATLTAHFRVSGDLSRIVIPPRRPSRRAEDLWRHTCFEFFVRARASAGYVEVNIAPSTEWAVYALAGYRAGIRPIEVDAPAIELSMEPGALAITATLPLDAFAIPATAAALEVALSAVIEAEDGKLSYWALTHPDPMRPDFHHPESFVHEVRY